MLRLRDFVSRRGDPLQLEALTGDLGLDRQMPEAEVASPGLALAGYTGRFAPNRIHVFGETGFLVRHGDLDGLAARMLELADQPARLAALGTAARRFAEGLTWERTASETERHLQDIIAGSGAA